MKKLSIAMLLTLAGGTCVIGVAAAQSAEHEARRAALTRVEGRVVHVETPGKDADPAKGVVAFIKTEEGEDFGLELAPPATLEEIGFEIEKGDRIRARVFEPDPERADAPRGVQKIQNLSRGTMTRLRTLYRVPLWSNAGRWQGGPVRSGGGSGAGGPRHRGGR